MCLRPRGCCSLSLCYLVRDRDEAVGPPEGSRNALIRETHRELAEPWEGRKPREGKWDRRRHPKEVTSKKARKEKSGPAVE